MINEILAYIIVGLLTLGWVLSIVLDMLKKIYKNKEKSSAEEDNN